MEDEFSKKTELLSALTGIKEKLDAVHIDVLAVKKQHNMIMGDPILDFYETCQKDFVRPSGRRPGGPDGRHRRVGDRWLYRCK